MTVAQLEVGVRVGVGQVRDDQACVVQVALDARRDLSRFGTVDRPLDDVVLLEDRLDDLGEKKVRPLAREGAFVAVRPDGETERSPLVAVGPAVW